MVRVVVVLGLAIAVQAGAAQKAAPVFAAQAVPQLPPPSFDVWLADLRVEAAARGISQDTIAQALGDIEPVAQILERDRTQAEFVLDVDAYLKRRLTSGTIRTARQMHERHRALLQRISKTYGVPSRLIIAVWGLESTFGRFAGVRPTFPTLATLAYDPRRASFFRQELFAALEILDRGDIELARMKGSWAGAMGQPQFMPSSYLKFAQDFDEDGRRDIWASLPDVFASVAYYLQQQGWTAGEAWGREVRVPAAVRSELDAVPTRDTGCRAQRLMSVPRPLTEWRKLGLRTLANGRLPSVQIDASFVPAGARHFLVYPNYEAILRYNCAHTYALSVALLSDAIR